MARRRRRATPESLKISKLRNEGVPQRQALAMALSMKRAHRLTPGGGYIRSRRRRERR